jgi:hypothetical protein
MKTFSVLCWLSLILGASAIDWDTALADPFPGASSTSGNCRVGGVSVDRAGRVHLVVLDQDEDLMRYVVRPNATTGFEQERILTFSSGASPVHADIDVGPDFTIDIAYVRGAGELRVVSEALDGTSLPGGLLAEDAMTGNQGGVSILSAGNGVSNAMIVYTRSDGSLGVVERGDEEWGSPQAVTMGANTGLAPKLVDAGETAGAFFPGFRPLIFSYNAAEDQVQVSERSIIAGVGWDGPEKIADAPGFSRPGAHALGETVGMAFSFFEGNGSGNPPTRRVTYASENGEGDWVPSTVASSGELEEDVEFFGAPVAVVHDGVGNPWVAYTRDVFVLIAGGSLDLRARRFIPGSGWELSIVEDLPGSGTEFFTGTLDMAANGAGDPALIYERDPGSEPSRIYMARPFSQPWTIGSPEPLRGEVNHTFAPALCQGQDGAHHLVVGTATGGGFSLPAVISSPRSSLFVTDYRPEWSSRPP